MAESKILQELIDALDKMSEKEQLELLEYIKLRPFVEKRLDHRKPYSTPLDYSVDNRFYRDFITDISSTGIFLSTNKDFSAGQKVTMALPLPGRKGEFKLTGTIVRAAENGIGIKFDFRSRVTEEIVRERISSLDLLQ